MLLPEDLERFFPSPKNPPNYRAEISSLDLPTITAWAYVELAPVPRVVSFARFLSLYHSSIGSYLVVREGSADPQWYELTLVDGYQPISTNTPSTLSTVRAEALSAASQVMLTLVDRL